MKLRRAASNSRTSVEMAIVNHEILKRFDMKGGSLVGSLG
jgi:hypothetical protein